MSAGLTASSLVSPGVDGREDRGNASVSRRRIARGEGDRTARGAARVRWGAALDREESDLRVRGRGGRTALGPAPCSRPSCTVTRGWGTTRGDRGGYL